MTGNNPSALVKFYDPETGRELAPYDFPNAALRVSPVTGSFGIPNYDAVKLTQTALTDAWGFYTGGLGGTLLSTITVTFTDATKATIDTVVKT